MKRVKAYLFFFLVFLHSPLVSFSVGADLGINDAFGPTRTERNLPIADGFAGLKWGVSIEEAHRTYTDLREDNSRAYSQYIKGGKDNAAWFVRQKENLIVGGYSMNSIEYKFQNGKFVAVGIGGSCDEDTPCNAQEIYQNIIKAIRRIYGKPYEIASRIYEDDKTVSKRGGVVNTEEITWRIDDESINISKTVEPKFSSINISIFSYQGYFIAVGQER
jgi:hypothetical protein